ncbi:DUF6197 family protein [Streptomyces sp. NEAU-174]|uniref:DUF6197 family protein n=1 Tax=Streptomyces sp. NEAU-174 TaxID=3458254 RepID=UPI004044DA08
MATSPTSRIYPTPREFQERRTGLWLTHAPSGRTVHPGDTIHYGPERETVTFIALHSTGTGALRVRAQRAEHDGIVEQHPNDFRVWWHEQYEVDTVALVIEAAAAHLQTYGWRSWACEHDPRKRSANTALPPQQRACHIEEALNVVVHGTPDALNGHSGSTLLESTQQVLENYLSCPLGEYEDEFDRTADDVITSMQGIAGLLRVGCVLTAL